MPSRDLRVQRHGQSSEGNLGFGVGVPDLRK